MTSRHNPPDPPEHVAEDVAEVWREVVAANGIVGPIDRAALEAYCTLTIRFREASKRVADEGMIVKSGTKEILHPAIALERQLAEQLHALGARFMPVTAPKRRRGPMYDATRKSFADAGHLTDREIFEGPREAVLTLAWLIDEAQRAGLDALQRATFNLIPSYLKACAELQITPASLPAVTAPGGKGASGGGNGPGKVSKFSEAAARRRERNRGTATG